MNAKDLLFDIMQDKFSSQRFYNDAMLEIINPSVRDLFKRFRDEEEKHGIILQQEILAIESKPFPVNKIMVARQEKYITNVDIDVTGNSDPGS
jgi:rubrerythrin